MCNRRPNIVAAVAISTAALVLTVSMAFAREVQLGGIRLGQHTLRVMEVYGQPDGVLKGTDPYAMLVPGQLEDRHNVTGAGAGAGAGMPGMGGPGGAGGAGGGMPGMAGGMMGAGGPGGPGGGMMGAGGPGGAMPGGGGMMGMMGGAGAGAGGGQATAAATGGSQDWFNEDTRPTWAASVWMPMLEDETMYVYRKGANVIGFLLDRDGYVLAIALAGRKCDWARTAMWNVKKSVKLGDDYNRLIARYGYPDSQVSFEPIMRPFTGSTTLAAAKAEFGGIENITRDLIITYKNDNIEFVLNDMKIIRIHIWEPDAREPEARNVGGAPQGGGMAGMAGPMGMGGGMGGPGGGMGPGPR